MRILRSIPALVLCSMAPLCAMGQQPACNVPAPQFQINKPDIFSLQQEQWLGDTQADQLEPDYTLLPEKDTTELTRIGKKLLAQLPPTEIQFTFRVYNDEEVNAFSIAGGHVYVSRKLISDAHSEDEVAGVVAHEIGHIYSRAMVIGETRQLKALLKVTALTDRRDVEDKHQLLINAPWKPAGEESAGEAESAELHADSIGLYAMTRAGYAPAAFAENLDRITDTKGKTSVFLKILAGESTETVVRIKTAHKVINNLPSDCKAGTAGKSASFAEFQQAMRTQSPRWLSDPTAGLASFQLDPPMRAALDWVRFSPDGNFILAQDESTIHVLSRSPFKLLFNIDADGANRAHFSPDSRRISFDYDDKRVESWDISTQTRASIHDLIDYRGCWASSLAPDGKTFVCMRIEGQGVGLSLLDVDTEKVYYENKKFNEFPGWGNRGQILYTPDGKTVLAAVGGRSIAFDLTERKQIPMRGNLSTFIATRSTFVGNDKVAFQCDYKTLGDGSVLFSMCVDSFPAGEKLGKFPIGDQWLRSTTSGGKVLMGPAKENAALLIDPATGNILRAFRLPQVDMYGDTLVSETAKGDIALKEPTDATPKVIDLPTSPLRPIAAGDFSADGRYLAYSHSSRGSIWNLEQHKQISLIRPFSALRFDDKDQVQLHLITSFQKPGANLLFNPSSATQTAGAPFAEDQDLVSGVLVHFKPLDKGFEGVVANLEMQVSDPLTGKQLWTRHFSDGRPRMYETDGDSFVIAYDLLSNEGAAETSHHKDKVIKSSDTMKEWVSNGLVIEFLNAHTGEVQRILQTPTRPSFVNDHRWLSVFGNYVAVHGSLNNTVVYRLSDGVRTCAFFGRILAGDGAQGLLAVNNRGQEMVVYDAATGNEVQRVMLDHLPRAARFVPSTHSLMVLTASQRVYTIPLGPASVNVTASAK